MNLTKDIDVINKKLNNCNIRKSEKRKLEAIKYHLLGMSTLEIQAKLGVNIRSIQRYIKEYKKNSIDEVKEEKNKKVKISSEDMSRLIECIKISPTKFRFAVDEWNCSMLRKFLIKDFSIKISEGYCRAILSQNEYYGKENKDDKVFEKKLRRIELNEANAIWYLDKLYVGKRKIISKYIYAYFLLAFDKDGKRVRYKYFVDYKNKTSKDKIIKDIKDFASELVKENKVSETYIFTSKDRYFVEAFRKQRFKKESRRRIIYITEKYKNNRLINNKKIILNDNRLLDKKGCRQEISIQKVQAIERYLKRWDLK